MSTLICCASISVMMSTTYVTACSKNIFYPLTSLDIVCHEIGHSITQWHGGNMEYQGQSGGMNEAYSDILGSYNT